MIADSCPTAVNGEGAGVFIPDDTEDGIGRTGIFGSTLFFGGFGPVFRRLLKNAGRNNAQ